MPEIIVILDNIRSAYNVGSLARTCDGFGVKQIISLGITPHMSQPSDKRLPHIIRRAEKEISKTALDAERLMGPHYSYASKLLSSIPDHQLVCLEQTDASIELQTFRPTSDIALVLGNEVNGVQNDLLMAATSCLEIPMHGDKESFNVGVAGAIALYEITSNFATIDS